MSYLSPRALAAQSREVLVASVADGAAEIARLREALGRIDNWVKAYPIDQFPDQDFKKADTALAGAGISMGALHGHWARHLLKGIGTIASEALEATK